MSKQKIKYYQASAVMIGYIVGVGMFGLPYLVAKAGLVSFLVFLLILIPVQYLLHLIYASMILNTRTYHRLPGYTDIYLGKKWKMIVFVAKVIGNMGALLAYIIITGIFLKNLLHPYFGGNEFIYATMLFVVEAAVVYFGVSMIAKAELFMTSLLVLVVCLIVFHGLPYVKLENYTIIDWKYFLIPYGALLFSLDGNGSLPMIAKLLDRDHLAMKTVIRHSSFVSALIIIIFTLCIVGISGQGTTADALSGVHNMMDGAISLALIFGIFSMVTSFFGVAESIRETLSWDFKIRRRLAWAISVFTPYLLYLCGIENLIKVISFVGSIGGGVCGVALVLIFYKIRKQNKGLEIFDYKPPLYLKWPLIFLFLMGICYTLWGYLLK